mgnify:CR=1 FL=1
MTIESSTIITKDNYFTQVHANIFNLINNRSNVPDPAYPNDTGTTRSRKFIHIREPNYMSNNFDKNAGFPFIIVPDPETSQANKTADGTKAFQDESFEIIIMTQDKSSDESGDPTGAQQMRDIKTNIKKILDNKTNAQTLRDNGLRNRTSPSITQEWGEIDGKKMFRTEFNLRFSNQLRTIV